VPINGELVTFEPGNLFVNNTNRTEVEDTAAKNIAIVQDKITPKTYYDFGTISGDVIDRVFTLDQDIYITGSVINENGGLLINNREGSISVSGIIRAETITVQS